LLLDLAGLVNRLRCGQRREVAEDRLVSQFQLRLARRGHEEAEVVSGRLERCVADEVFRLRGLIPDDQRGFTRNRHSLIQRRHSGASWGVGGKRSRNHRGEESSKRNEANHWGNSASRTRGGSGTNNGSSS